MKLQVAVKIATTITVPTIRSTDLTQRVVQLSRASANVSSYLRLFQRSISKMTASPQVLFKDLLDASQLQMAFHDPMWFKTHGLTRSFPTPSQVRAQCSVSGLSNFRLVAKFEELQVPVPEVYGWIVDCQQVFLYMQLIRGPTLLERWGTMSYYDKRMVCSHLQFIIHSLRQTKQDHR